MGLVSSFYNSINLGPVVHYYSLFWFYAWCMKRWMPMMHMWMRQSSPSIRVWPVFLTQQNQLCLYNVLNANMAATLSSPLVSLLHRALATIAHYPTNCLFSHKIDERVHWKSIMSWPLLAYNRPGHFDNCDYLWQLGQKSKVVKWWLIHSLAPHTLL